MIINFHKSFRKQASTLKPAQKKRLKQALLLFTVEPHHVDLYNHPLTGDWKNFRSISFGGKVMPASMNGLIYARTMHCLLHNLA